MTPEEAEAARAAAAAETTALLAAARAGDRAAFDRVFARLYDDLRRVASRQAARLGGSGTISTTALVHEVYLKLGGDRIVPGEDRIHFFALASRAMRQILVDHARHGARKKRGGGLAVFALDPEALDRITPEPAVPVDDLLALDLALERLADVDPELGRMVEWRFFGGLTLEEISGLTGTSERTLKRDWQVARAFLLRELATGAGA